MLEIKQLSVGYNGETIVENINFCTHSGKLTALLGLNGAGKTTLLKTISGLLSPLSGHCLVNGRDTLTLKDKERGKYLSYMPQRPSIIYHMPVEDVVLMGMTPYLGMFETPSKKHRKMAREMIHLVGMDSYTHDSFLHLSEGQKQLIIVARNLLQQASVMLFDEPDSALDFKNRHMILGKIKQLIKHQNRTGIITLHDPNDALYYCDQIIVVHNGSILTRFDTHSLDLNRLKEIFSIIYGKIDVIQHEQQYMIVRKPQ